MPPVTSSRGQLRFDVVGVGEISVDDVLLLDGPPAWGRKIRVARRDRLGGGQVATAMVAARRLGLATALIGAVGDDEPGRFALDELRAEGVDVQGVRIGEGATHLATIVIDERGDRTVLWSEDDRLTGEGQIGEQSIVATIRQSRVLHVDGNQIDMSIAAAQVARSAGVLVSCDLDRIAERTAELLRLVDVCIVPQDFLVAFAPEAAADSEVDPEVDPEHEGRLRVLATHLKSDAIACVTLGARGAAALCGAAFVQSHGFRIDRVIDTTACGDTFRAGFLAALLDGGELAACLRYANAAAAIKTSDLGRRGCPTRREVDEFLSARATSA